MHDIFIKTKLVHKNFTDREVNDIKLAMEENEIDAPVPDQYEDIIINTRHIVTIKSICEADRKIWRYPEDARTIMKVNGISDRLVITASVEEITEGTNRAVKNGGIIVQV